MTAQPSLIPVLTVNVSQQDPIPAHSSVHTGRDGTPAADHLTAPSSPQRQQTVGPFCRVPELGNPPYGLRFFRIPNSPEAYKNLSHEGSDQPVGMFIGQLPDQTDAMRVTSMLVTLSNELGFPLRIQNVDVHHDHGTFAFVTLNRGALDPLISLHRSLVLDGERLWVADTRRKQSLMMPFLRGLDFLLRPLVIQQRSSTKPLRTTELSGSPVSSHRWNNASPNPPESGIAVGYRVDVLDSSIPPGISTARTTAALTPLQTRAGTIQSAAPTNVVSPCPNNNGSSNPHSNRMSVSSTDSPLHILAPWATTNSSATSSLCGLASFSTANAPVQSASTPTPPRNAPTLESPVRQLNVCDLCFSAVLQPAHCTTLVPCFAGCGRTLWGKNAALMCCNCRSYNVCFYCGTSELM